MPDCQSCTRPTPDVNLCGGCVDTIRAELRSVPWLAARLEVPLTRQTASGQRNGSPSANRPLPFDWSASVDLEALRDTLAVWARDIAARRHVTLDAPHTPTGYARWLLRWPTEIALHPDAGMFHSELVGLTRACRRTIDRHPDMMFLGPCDECAADLYAPINAVAVTCRGEHDDTTPCGAVFDIPSRRVWLLEQAQDQLRTARQLSAELPWIAGVTVTAKLIGMWSVRGKITPFLPHPQDPDRAARFRVGEVIDRAREMAVDRQSRVTGAA